MRIFGVVLVVFLMLLCVACSPIENQSRDAAAALSGSIVAAQSKYGDNCTANPKQDVCVAINRAVSGENALVTAVEAYCGWASTLAPPDPKATCVPVKTAIAALQTAIANAGVLTIQIKGVL